MASPPFDAGRQMLIDQGITLVSRPADVMDDTIIAGLGANAVVAEMHEERIRNWCSRWFKQVFKSKVYSEFNLHWSNYS